MKKQLHSAKKFDNAIAGRYWCNVAAAVIGSVAGAAISAGAAGDAADAQGEASAAASAASLTASRESNALQKEMYDQNRTDSAPWRDVGAGALNQLAWGMGIPSNQLGTSAPRTRDEIYKELLDSGQYAQAGTPGTSGGKRGFQATIMRNTAPSTVDYARLNAEADRMFAAQPSQAYSGDPATAGKLGKSFTLADYQADPGYQFRLDEGNKGIERSAAARGSQLSGATLKALARFGQDTASNEYQNSYNRFNNDQSTQFNRLSGIAGTGQQQVNALGQAGQNYANQVGNNTINTANQIGSNTIGAGNARAASYVSTANGINNAIGTGINAWQQQNALGTNNMGDDWNYDTWSV